MGVSYTHRDMLKGALGIPASTTGDHGQLDAVMESVSRLIEKYCGMEFYPSSGTYYYTPTNSRELYLDTPLLAVDSIGCDFNGDASYEVTMASDAYFLSPYNATAQAPRAPWWTIETRINNATAVFAARIQRGARIVGRWGYYDEHAPIAGVTLAAAATSGATALTLNGSTNLHAGQTILIDSEQLYVVQAPASATASHSSGISVTRALNGTTAAAHTSGTAIDAYSYPIIDRAALYQCEQDYRAKDTPMGFAGGEPFGNQQMRPGMGGLHPFVRRMLDPFRQPLSAVV